MDVEQYKFPFDKKTEKKAEKDLNEIPKERLGALKSFRDWVIQQQHWLKCPSDVRLLLPFLRTGKFTQLKARERFINFWTKRSQHPKWFMNIDTKEDKLLKVLRAGIFFPLPGQDSEGRKIIWGRWGMADPSDKSYSRDEYLAGIIAFFDLAFMDEQGQISGYVFVNDVGGVTLKHQTWLGIDAMTTMTNVFMKAYPLRYSQIHYYNTGPVFEAIFAIIKPAMPKKLVQRITFHGNNLTSVYDKIDKTLLPDEYLPDDHKGKSAGPIAQIVDNFIQDLHKPENRDIILRMSSPDSVSIDLAKKPNNSELLVESFRMLSHD